MHESAVSERLLQARKVKLSRIHALAVKNYSKLSIYRV